MLNVEIEGIALLSDQSRDQWTCAREQNGIRSSSRLPSVIEGEFGNLGWSLGSGLSFGYKERCHRIPLARLGKRSWGF